MLLILPHGNCVPKDGKGCPSLVEEAPRKALFLDEAVWGWGGVVNPTLLTTLASRCPQLLSGKTFFKKSLLIKILLLCLGLGGEWRGGQFLGIRVGAAGSTRLLRVTAPKGKGVTVAGARRGTRGRWLGGMSPWWQRLLGDPRRQAPGSRGGRQLRSGASACASWLEAHSPHFSKRSLPACLG